MVGARDSERSIGDFTALLVDHEQRVRGGRGGEEGEAEEMMGVFKKLVDK